MEMGMREEEMDTGQNGGFSTHCYARSEAAKIAHNRRERERRRKTAEAFENIRQLLGFLGYDSGSKDKPAILHSVQVALLHEAMNKGIVDASSTLKRNIEADCEGPVNPPEGRKRARTDEPDSPSSTSSFFADSFYNNSLPQSIVDENFTITETNASFRQSFCGDQIPFGRSVLEVCHSDSHPKVEHSLATVFNQLRKKQRVEGKRVEALVECHLNMRKKEGRQRVKCTVSGFVSASIPYAQLSFTRAIMPPSEESSKHRGANETNGIAKKQLPQSTHPIAPPGNVVPPYRPDTQPRSIAPTRNAPRTHEPASERSYPGRPMAYAPANSTARRVPPTHEPEPSSERAHRSRSMVYAAANSTARNWPPTHVSEPSSERTYPGHSMVYVPNSCTGYAQCDPRHDPPHVPNGSRPTSRPPQYSWSGEPYGGWYSVPEGDTCYSQAGVWAVPHPPRPPPPGMHSVASQVPPGYPRCVQNGEPYR
eukprot:gb/GECG01001313.1/.p1 GENE.gb/GECG01001313.1/~~gb/GECG01001313.1/.p1  ORF type:complete len:480 (+),score=50.95 gb/GECG01001313.1/:1-1440(+)